MHSRYMKNCSVSLITREMQIKTTRYHIISAKMAIIIRRKKNRQVLESMWRNWKSCTLLVGTRNGEAAMKTVWSFLKKLKIE